MKPPDDFDSPWKEAIALHFRDFLRFFFPEIEADIDWSQGYQLLESEFQALSRDSKNRRRHVDALIQVTRKSGQKRIVIVHAEIQSQFDRNFASRMLLYHTRIRDRYDMDVCSLAILGDTNPRWRPDCYRAKLWGTQLKLKFPMRKLLDYPDWAEGTANPFAWLTAAHRQAQSTRLRPELRAQIKRRLIRGLYSCGLTRAQLLELFRLLDWVLALPAEMEYDFKRDLARFEEEKNMVYVSSVERIARKEGLEAGRAEGIEAGRAEGLDDACRAVRTSILQRLQQRWRPDPKLIKKLQKVSDFDQLLALHVLAATAESLQEWAAELKA